MVRLLLATVQFGSSYLPDFFVKTERLKFVPVYKIVMHVENDLSYYWKTQGSEENIWS
jgi:hypothetical protein